MSGHNIDGSATVENTGSDSRIGDEAHPSGSLTDTAAGPSEPAEAEDAGRDPDDERLIGLLAAGLSQVRAADEANISSRTVRRRLQDPGFKALVDQRKRQLHEKSWIRMIGLRDKAADVFDAALGSDDERVRLQAARSIYDLGTRIRREQEGEDLRDRIDELEREVDQRTADQEQGS